MSESSSSALASLALAGFCVNSFLVRVAPPLPIQILPVQAVSIMGGVFSCLPPYEAELYGSRCHQNLYHGDFTNCRWVGAIHGKFLPFSTVRGIAGPAILLALRQREESKAIENLLSVVDPHLFAETFGAG